MQSKIQAKLQENLQENLRRNLLKLRADLCEKSSELWSYMAYGDEAPAAEVGSNTAYPKVMGSELEFYFAKPQNMKVSQWGISEPRPESSRRAKRPAMILIPGLGFDRAGGRIGSGKGFYDRLLPKFPQAIRVGVAYSAQVLNEPVPLEPHDQQMDWLVTENYILQCQRKD